MTQSFLITERYTTYVSRELAALMASATGPFTSGGAFGFRVRVEYRYGYRPDRVGD